MSERVVDDPGQVEADVERNEPHGSTVEPKGGSFDRRL